MPITTLFWHEIVGYRTVIVLVGAEEDWQSDKAASLAVEFTKKLCPGTEFIYLENKTRYPAYILSQLIRPLTALKYPNDFSITSDIDMLPLQKDYFKVTNVSKLHHFDPGVLGRPPYEIAMCYIGAIGSLWQKLLKAKNEDVAPEYIEKIVDKYKGFDRVRGYAGKKNKPFWGVDQMYLTEHILYSDEYKMNLFKPADRDLDPKTNLLNDRVDKVKWEFNPRKKGYYVDAHLVLNEPWNRSTRNWKIFKKLLKTYVPSEVADIVRYTDDFSKSCIV